MSDIVTEILQRMEAPIKPQLGLDVTVSLSRMSVEPVVAVRQLFISSGMLMHGGAMFTC